MIAANGKSAADEKEITTAVERDDAPIARIRGFRGHRGLATRRHFNNLREIAHTPGVFESLPFHCKSRFMQSKYGKTRLYGNSTVDFSPRSKQSDRVSDSPTC
jgi:hypothetical protein